MEIRHNLFPLAFVANPVAGYMKMHRADQTEDIPHPGQPGTRFSTGGYSYFIPDGELAVEEHSAQINLDDFPFLLMPSVLRMVAAAASELGQTAIEGDGLILSPSDKGGEVALSVEMVDGRLHLLISLVAQAGAPGIEGRMHYEQVDALARRLSERIARDGNRLGIRLEVDTEGMSLAGMAKMRNPTYQFTPGGIHPSAHRLKSLRETGPFSRRSFQARETHVLAVCRRENEGDFETLLKGFKDGFPHAQRHGHYPWPIGFKAMFRTGDLRIHKLLLSGHDLFAQLQRVREKVSELSSKNMAPQLALFQAPQAGLLPHTDLYPGLKACLMDYGIPSQGMRVEMAYQVDEFQKAEAMFNIALAAYAKLGGKPWLITAYTAVAHEFVIGLGCAPAMQEKGSKVGFSAIFSSMGDYKLGTSSQLVGVEDGEGIAAELSRMLLDVRRKDNWGQGDTVRLIFHLHESITRFPCTEIKEHLVNALGCYQELSFAFLEIGYGHRFRFWDISRAQRELEHTAYLPERGCTLFLDDWRALIQLYTAGSTDPVLHPMLIRLLANESDFLDLRYLCQQVHDFSAISWRSIRECHLPVTIEYGQELTRLLSLMDEAGLQINQNLGWDNLKARPWYL